jgi:hypothetical protein
MKLARAFSMAALLATTALSAHALAGEAGGSGAIDPATLSLPWTNGPARNARYVFAQHPDTVHVLEAFTNSCRWCNKNADQVQALARRYASEPRVQFLDLGLDQDEASHRRWIAAHAPAYPVVMDVGLAVYHALAPTSGVPQTFVVDCAGALVDYTVGFWGADEEATLTSAIARALERQCP